MESSGAAVYTFAAVSLRTALRQCVAKRPAYYMLFNNVFVKTPSVVGAQPPAAKWCAQGQDEH